MGKRKQRRQPQTLIPSNGAEEDQFIDQRSEEHSEVDAKSGFFACYLLTSLCPRYKGHTYIGFTVNPRRRIRQHNGELCSGAWRTKKKRPWEMVLCIHGFPTNTAALQFEWAWQHPVESLAVRKAAVAFKSLGGLANKIKLAYTMLTLPTWNNLNLSVNFFSTKYTKHYAGCPTLPSQMRVHIRSMDELPCYTEGYKEDEDDMLRFENDPSDDDDGSEKSFEDATIPVSSSTNYHNNEEEANSVLGSGNYKQPSCTNKDPCDDDKEPSTVPVSVSADHQSNESEAICVSDDENFEQPSCSNNKDLRDDDDELETIQVPVSADHQNNEKEAICVSDDESYEPSACSNILKRSFTDTSYFNGKKDGSKKKISGSGGEVEVEVVDLFSPSPEYRIRKKRGVSAICPEIIDLTESPICV